MPLPLVRLFLLHIFIIVLSNYAVQIPITVLGIETTVGTFTFPFVFVTTDLTVRLYGAQLARKVIFCAMLLPVILDIMIKPRAVGIRLNSPNRQSKINNNTSIPTGVRNAPTISGS